MTRLVTLFLSLTLVSIAACEGDAKEEAPAEEEPHAVEADLAEEKRPEGTPEGTPDGQPRRTMKEVMEAVTQSVKDSKESETGDTVCERAYSGQVAMSENLMKALGAKEPPPQVDRAAFIEVCEGASAEVQQCLVPSYALEHREECRTVKENAGPELTAKLKALGEKARENRKAADPAEETP